MFYDLFNKLLHSFLFVREQTAKVTKKVSLFKQHKQRARDVKFAIFMFT